MSLEEAGTGLNWDLGREGVLGLDVGALVGAGLCVCVCVVCVCVLCVWVCGCVGVWVGGLGELACVCEVRTQLLQP